MGLSDLGGAVSWGEALTLLQDAAGDPSTAFGAELAGWSFPATVPTLLGLIAQVGNEKASRRIMPWTLKLSDSGAKATAEEIAAAQRELEDGIVFN